MPENIIPGFTDRIDAAIDHINDVLETWESVKRGEYTQEQVDRGRVIILSIQMGAK